MENIVLQGLNLNEKYLLEISHLYYATATITSILSRIEVSIFDKVRRSRSSSPSDTKEKG
jgi:hypothetical protein